MNTTYPFKYEAPAWGGAGTKEINVKIISVEDGEATVRAPDPYDKGEVEFKTALRNLWVDATHKFVHSSMAGSYETECLLLDEEDGNARILYIDGFIGEPVEIVIETDDLLPLVDRFDQLMQFYQVDDKDELIEAMEHHILRLQAKLPKSKDLPPLPARIG